MSKLIKTDESYRSWLTELKQRIRQSQIKAAVKVNTEMLRLYWSIGEDIVGRKAEAQWGKSVINLLSQDLQETFPRMQGFSPRNLAYMKQWYLFYSQGDIFLQQVAAKTGKAEVSENVGQPTTKTDKTEDSEFLPQPVAKIDEAIFSIPWSHHRYILDKVKDVDEALFYVHQTLEHGWSRNVLLNMMDSGLYKAHGKAITNFAKWLPESQSDLAQQTLKDPYNFDFLTLKDGYAERELEDALTENITRFLLEMGNGFAFIGRQVRMMIGEEEYFLDLLFYNYKLRCFVVGELKTGKFRAEYVSKLGLYVTAVNHQMKQPDDHPTIGLLICKNKDEVVAKYTLEATALPIGISEYQLNHLLPDDFKSSLPSIEDIENELKE